MLFRSAGVSGDLRNATTISTWMEAMWGMGSTLSSAPALMNGIGGGFPMATGVNVDRETAGLPSRIETRLGRIFDQARDLLAENRTMVLAVAHALETHKTISGEDVAAIVNGTVGPKVDGRVYHRPEFAALAEEYHAIALQAHQNVDDVNAALPVLPPVE
mgnify:CR=1 FL=1